MNPDQEDQQTAFIKELQSRYNRTGPGSVLSANDIERWTEIVGSTMRPMIAETVRNLANDAG